MGDAAVQQAANEQFMKNIVKNDGTDENWLKTRTLLTMEMTRRGIFVGTTPAATMDERFQAAQYLYMASADGEDEPTLNQVTIRNDGHMGWFALIEKHERNLPEQVQAARNYLQYPAVGTYTTAQWLNAILKAKNLLDQVAANDPARWQADVIVEASIIRNMIQRRDEHRPNVYPSNWTPQLKKDIRATATLHAAFTEIYDWERDATEDAVTDHTTASIQAPKTANESKQKQICRFWLQDKCNRGKNCRFLHTRKHTATSTDRKGKGNQMKKVKCYYCKLTGHRKAECRKRLAQLKEQKLTEAVKQLQVQVAATTKGKQVRRVVQAEPRDNGEEDGHHFSPISLE